MAANAVVAPDGPPKDFVIAGETWRIVKLGICLPMSHLTKENILRLPTPVTWHEATWVAKRRSAGWNAPAGAGGDADAADTAGKYVAHPLFYCHYAGEQSFLSKEVAFEVDAAHAIRVGVEVDELDRDEQTTLTYGSPEEKFSVPVIPKHDQLAPAGYVAPVFKRTSKKSKDGEDGSDGDADDCDEDDDTDAEEERKTEKNKKQQKKSDKAKKSVPDLDEDCPWFLGRLEHVSEYVWTPSVKEVRTASTGAGAAASDGKKTTQQKTKQQPAAPQKKTAEQTEPARKKRPSEGGAAEAPKPGAQLAKKQKVTPAANGNKPAVGKGGTTAAKPPVGANGNGVKKSSVPNGKTNHAVLIPVDMFAKCAPAKMPALAPSKKAHAAIQKPTNQMGHTETARNGHPGDDDVLFVLKAGQHEQNMRRIMAYLGASPEMSEEARAMVKFLTSAARDKPDGHAESVFRRLGLAPAKYSFEDLTRSARNLPSAEQERARTSFAAMRAVFCELFAAGPEEEVPDARDW
jgi:hypothetical protein